MPNRARKAASELKLAQRQLELSCPTGNWPLPDYRRKGIPTDMADKLANFPLADHATITAVVGLMLPRRSPKVHPLRWMRSDTGRRPDWVRWVWHPLSGDTRVGRVIHHYELLGKKRTQLSQWVRGFYFPQARLLAVRTYFNPSNALDEFDAAHRELDERVSSQIVLLLGVHLPKARFATGVDNRWLENRFPRLCQW